ncbi:MAG: nitric oxide reductase activation protein [Lachnospiraceae bacterium]|nr:nitric oxide reductase activation protein [Lachnospiraceae bacterium]
MTYDETDFRTDIDIENRLRNLMWTVSGDYALDTKLDAESYGRSKYISLYDAVKQGAFARFFDKNAFALYLVKKVYLGADERPLAELAQLCVDAAVWRPVAAERPGVPELRKKAFSDLLEHSFHKMSATLPGRVKIAWMKYSLYGDCGGEKQIRESVQRIRTLENIQSEGADSGNVWDGRSIQEESADEGSARDGRSIQEESADEGSVRDGRSIREECAEGGTARDNRSFENSGDDRAAVSMGIIRTVDTLYNTLIDKSFERKHGSLEQVLSVTLEDLQEFDWSDFLKEEISEDLLEQYFNQMNQMVTTLREEPDEEPEQPPKAKRKVILIDEESAEKMHSYMELNYGRSYLTKREQEQKNLRLCRGAHADCSLYDTEGILENPVLSNAQYVKAKRYAEKNRVHFRNHQHLIARNVEQLSDELRRSLNRRSEPEWQDSYAGSIVPRRLWQIERKDPPGRLFTKMQRRSNAEFAVDILIDASGSQRDRQGDVAMQAFILAEALLANRIPLQITSFCTFWDYTVLQRFRTYDAPRKDNRKLLNFVASSNNRDGLAIRAAGDSLLRREEEGKILIVLSDGKPNDIIVNRPNSRNPRPYYGDYAVQDTAFEVRKLRGAGVCVLGVFTGKESELAAEKKIFGKDFTYIRDTSGFARVVARYLRRLLEEDGADF